MTAASTDRPPPDQALAEMADYAVGTAIVYDNNPDPDRLYTYAVYKGTTEDGKTRYDAYAFDSELNPVAELKDYLMIPTQI